MESLIIEVKTAEENEEAQNLFFNLGYCWFDKMKKYRDFSTPEHIMTFENGALSTGVRGSICHKQITLQELRDMVVLKRNDVNDANFTCGLSKVLKLETMDYKIWDVEQKSWVDYVGSQTDFRRGLKPIQKEKTMKEWIYKDGSGEYVLTTDPEVSNLAADAIEVLSGADCYVGYNNQIENGWQTYWFGRIKNGMVNEIHEEYETGFNNTIDDLIERGQMVWQRQQTNETGNIVQGKNGDYLVDGVEQLKAFDNVNHPSHYTTHPSGIECIDITRHHDFAIGNAIKYLWRAGLKDSDNEVQDLKKAIWYIQDKINQLGG